LGLKTEYLLDICLIITGAHVELNCL
jgi:hypothetical protein